VALVECPDCSASVSDQAVACPQCARPMTMPSTSSGQAEESEGDGWGFYFLGYFLALIIFCVKYGVAYGLTFGWMVALLSWLYVGFALIQAIFT